MKFETAQNFIRFLKKKTVKNINFMKVDEKIKKKMI